MNNLRKTAVLLFIGVLTISMALLPFTPTTDDSQVAAPTDYEQQLIEKWSNQLDEGLVMERVDPILVSYMETGVLDEAIVTTSRGDFKMLLYVDPGFDTNAIADLVNVRWQIDLKLTRVISVDVSSVTVLRQLDAMQGIRYLQADAYIDRTVDSYGGDEVSLDMFHINDIVGATQAHDLGYTGDGVVVGVDDTGIDFSQSDMQDTEYNNGTHPMSYDPSSMGLTMMYLANSTVVDNVTEWLAQGYLLTYEMGGSYYLNVTGWNPVCNNGGAGRSLLAGGYIGLYEGAWGINNATEFVMNEIWMDWEIPAPGSNNYTFGWVQQQRVDAYQKVFAFSMILDGDVIIDWNGSYAFTTLWTEAFWFESIDLNVTADRDMITDMMDWSFVDDIGDGNVYNLANNILYADTIVGGHEMGLGSLSWAYDSLGYLDTDYGLFCGITDDYMAWNALFAGGYYSSTRADENHGHWTAAAIASQGVYDHDVYGNGTTYNLPGIAPGAKIIFAKGLSTGGDLESAFWAAGFHLNATSGYFEYTGDGPSHHADIVSNSWGWGPGASYLQMRLYTMIYDIASVPDVMQTGYPGTLFVFSAGNHGGDYGTMGSPGASFSVIGVGATMASHYYQSIYSQYPQTDNQHVWFAGMGPTFSGYVKPDVLAPGYRGVSPQPSHNEWYDIGGDTYYWWQGTSLSCPIVAGVAAVVMEAWSDNHGSVMPTPQLTKDLVLSTAADLGYDPFIQGHGLVDAYAAVQAIDSGAADQYYFESASFVNYAAQIADAWAYWIPDWAPFDGIYYDASWTTPVGLESSSIFFGTVERDGSYTVNLDVTGFDGNPYQTAAFDSVADWMYTELSTESQGYTSYVYNDTNFAPVVERPGYFVLDTLMDLTDFYASDYATIYVTYDAADIGDYPIVRLFDWADDGELNYWNFTTGTGDDLRHVTRYTDQCNIMTLRLGAPHESGLASVFVNEPTLQFDGPAGIDFTVTVIAWQKVDDPDVSVADGTTGIDVTLDVATDAEYGIHEGSILFADGLWFHQVPYSYLVDFNLDGAEGAVHTLVNGAGTHTPYETGAVTTSFLYGTANTYEGGGLYTFHLDIPYNIAINASVLVMRAEWQNEGTVVDMYLYNELGNAYTGVQTNDGGRPFDPVPTGDLTNTLIYNPGDLVNGTYWFYYAVHVFDGADVPEDITITMQLYGPDALPDAENSFWWTANDNPTPTAINPGELLVGDHVEIVSNWSIPAVAGLPEYSTIPTTTLSLLSGLYADFTGTYPNPGGLDAWPISLALTSNYAWHTVSGIVSGDTVRVVLDGQGGADPSFDVWGWTDVNSDGLVQYDTELSSTSYLSVDNGGGGTAESGQYTAGASGSIAIRVFCWAYSYTGQHYHLEVDTRVALDLEPEAGTPDMVSYDTYDLFSNRSMDIRLTCYTETDVVWTIDFGQVSFANFFAPVVTVGAVADQGDNVFRVTWSSTDRNVNDENYYSVWISGDGGISYSVLARNLTVTQYDWDSTGFLEQQYIFRIRAYSVDFTSTVEVSPDTYWPNDVPLNDENYWPGDFADGFSAPFSAGDVPTTTEGPTTTTGGGGGGGITDLDPLLVGLVGGIGVGVVVILILFLIKKR